MMVAIGRGWGHAHEDCHDFGHGFDVLMLVLDSGGSGGRHGNADDAGVGGGRGSVADDDNDDNNNNGFDDLKW